MSGHGDSMRMVIPGFVKEILKKSETPSIPESRRTRACAKTGCRECLDEMSKCGSFVEYPNGIEELRLDNHSWASNDIMSLAFTNTVVVEFTDLALTFSEGSRQPITIPYRDHPEIFAHPRFLMTGRDQSAALVATAIRQLMGGRLPLIAPKFVVTINRPLEGGITEMDERSVAEILTKAGARKVEFNNASVIQR
jgi:hypothetical protein